MPNTNIDLLVKKLSLRIKLFGRTESLPASIMRCLMLTPKYLLREIFRGSEQDIYAQTLFNQGTLNHI